MKTLTAPELRRAADLLRAEFADDFRDNRAAAAAAHADQMQARADLLDAEAGIDNSGIADDYFAVQTLPLLGKIQIRAGRKIYVERPYNCEGEAHGIYVDFQWRSDPRAAEDCGTLVLLRIGTRLAGPLAQFCTREQQWYALSSRGNFGKKYASGGHWSSKKVAAPPEIFITLEHIMQEKIEHNQQVERIAKAKARLEAATLRLHAQGQRDGAAAHARQAAHPIYPGQEFICAQKNATFERHAAITEARADLILANAGL